MREMIEVNSLSCSIEGNEILKDVSILVGEKKRVGIIGPNGSGKSTLLKHIYRAIPPAANAVFLNGRSVEDYSYNDSARLLTVVKQENATDFDFTVEEIVLLGRAPYRKYFEAFTREDRELANQALESMGMREYAKRSFNQLSGGEKQRVLIARSLAQQADVFILDEPTNHLDLYYQWSLMRLIRDLGTTVLGVFHELNLASYFCDYLYVLYEGQIVRGGPPAEILTRELLAKVFRVDSEVTTQDGQTRILVRGAIPTQ